ncbi:MAG: amidohydrolase family protein [Acidobacteria bacterium]|nr:amidohydrolase family protein [Acidobacteriota bacterium]MBI3421397.1 amidohydrolase family protein [Acidobacteriota bacterium]
MLNRRQFLATSVLATAATGLRAQTAATTEWGGPVIDIHSHLRPAPDANMIHMQGCGVTHAVLLSRLPASEQVKAIQAKYPGRFVWAASTDITKPEAAELLTKAVKDGAQGLGEIKFHVEADGPELRRMYALAAELKVPILVHFQEVPHFEGEGVWSTGFKRFAAILKAYPKTTFIGHADAFWANVSADYAEQEAYPAGPIKRGGVTDKLLADYPNLYGDLSANSGNNALSRDPEFTADFLARQQNKLLFGSDCSCQDGKGGGVSQANNPAAARLRGKCVAHETLRILKTHAKPAAFRKLTWENAHKVFKLKA